MAIKNHNTLSSVKALRESISQHRLTDAELDDPEWQRIFHSAINKEDVITKNDDDNDLNDDEDDFLSFEHNGKIYSNINLSEEDGDLLNQQYNLLKHKFADFQEFHQKDTQLVQDKSDSDGENDIIDSNEKNGFSNQKKKTSRLQLQEKEKNSKNSAVVRSGDSTTRKRSRSISQWVPSRKRSKYIVLLLLVLSASALMTLAQYKNSFLNHILGTDRIFRFNNTIPSTLPLSRETKSYLSSNFYQVSQDLEGLRTRIEANEQSSLEYSQKQNDYIKELNARLREINNLIQGFQTENQQGIEHINKELMLKQRKIDEKFALADKRFEEIGSTLSEFKEFKQHVNQSLKSLQEQLTDSKQRFDSFVNDKFPKYVPTIQTKDGQIELMPEFQSQITNLIGEYVSQALNSNKTIPKFEPKEIIRKEQIEKYLSDFVQNNDVLNLVNLKNSSSSLSKFIKDEILHNLNGVVKQRLKGYEESKTKINKDENDRLIIDSTTELILSKLIKKIYNSNESKYMAKYNYADYENGARIVPELVSSFDSFNITELYNQQQQYKVFKKLKRVFGYGNNENAVYNKAKGKNMVLNTYQAILPSTVIAKDNFPNLSGHKTGVKTFAIKFAQPIYLTNLLISYPRFEKNAGAVYSAPKKISVWIKLKNPDTSLPKLKNYLYEATKDKYGDKYVINLEKFSQDVIDEESSWNKKLIAGHRGGSRSGSLSGHSQKSKNGDGEEDASSGDVNGNGGGTSNIPIKRLKSEEEIVYEKFYETNFHLFKQNYLKIGSMNYDLNSPSVNQKFPLLNASFKNLKLSIESIFFSIEDNYGDAYATNLFKVKAYGVSEFDLYCMKKLLYGTGNGSREGHDDFNEHEDDLIKLEELFNAKYVNNLDYEEPSDDLEQTSGSATSSTKAYEEEEDYDSNDYSTFYNAKPEQRVSPEIAEEIDYF